MLLYADQPTPPFNSPYQQHATRTSSLLESPYPSPVRHESRPKYPHGLGLYEYQQPLPTGLPPSPQPSEAWGGQFSAGASPLMPEAIADPWTSGAFDHPVSRSPLPWNSAQTSPRSSLSSYTREMSVFSHEDSEQAFPGVKLEGSAWGSEVQFSADASTAEMNGISNSRATPLTVAPERLKAGLYPYETAYPPSPMPRYVSTALYDYGGPKFERAPSEESLGSIRSRDNSSYTAGGVARERTRNRRHTNPAHAAYRCQLCPDKGFARRYNYNQHMLTHDTYRKKDNICNYPGCGKEFVRKTDLARHDQSVHQRAKPFKCAKCPSAFSRKDTLRRHEEDGCPRRNQVPVTGPHMLQQLRNDGY
ncbi:uncharacterized protein K460DRAFT_286764 [Cucurbitaria berberidis CBS 394.84]|uniref:C2H2-type domain-containing protein n=1 Tax=Cucurbitaria berberidis CBS 394.84 TaxID=1168544 RepID=A0A9P4GJJ4_9PLEO|nr:uncharacterized protein K460DRAFT_286764 [Cucurbitaria berberidis CBS 394.84]KAF1846614.1 hypothetical protein K460DRAFT_286764 [Cucurbitaria berberidis CBS 394.84]